MLRKIKIIFVIFQTPIFCYVSAWLALGSIVCLTKLLITGFLTQCLPMSFTVMVFKERKLLARPRATASFTNFFLLQRELFYAENESDKIRWMAHLNDKIAAARLVSRTFP